MSAWHEGLRVLALLERDQRFVMWLESIAVEAQALADEARVSGDLSGAARWSGVASAFCDAARGAREARL